METSTISEERPRDAAIGTLPVVALDHRHIVVRIEVMLHVEPVPPAEDLITYSAVLRVHAPSMEAILKSTERGIL